LRGGRYGLARSGICSALLFKRLELEKAWHTNGRQQRSTTKIEAPSSGLCFIFGLWPLDCTKTLVHVAKEVYMFLQERGGAHFIAGFGFGLAGGCLIGLLYAPQAGRRTRRQIAAALEDGADYVKAKAEDTGDYVHTQTSHLRNEAGELLNRGKEAIQEGRAALESTLDAGANLYRHATR
jgi:gas vesicle protein